MTQGRLLGDLVEYGIGVSFITSALFPVIGLPHFRIGRINVRIGFWPWWQNDWGWNIVAFDSVVALAILPSFLHRVAGVNQNTYLFGWIVAVSLWLIPAIIIWRAAMIWRAQRRT